MWISQERNILISNEEKKGARGEAATKKKTQTTKEQKKVADCADKFQFNCLLNKVILT